MYILIFYYIAFAVNGAAYENNKTNIGVYANRISSCNLDHKMGDMLCINRDYESFIQYHDVNNVVFCPYHYCVTFKTEKNKLACTGYSYLKMSGSMSDIINPLSPNNSALTFGEAVVENKKVGKSFEGYNILIDFFRQTVETYFPSGTNIVDVICEKKMTTCVYLSDGTESCFGALNLIFHDFLPSIFLGMVVPGSLSLVCFLILRSLSSKGFLYAKNGCVISILTPIMVEIFCMIILFVGADFIVKILPFLVASLIGIWIGKVLCDITTTGCFGFPWHTKVENEYGRGECDGMLDDDDAMTEIELGTIDDDDDH